MSKAATGWINEVVMVVDTEDPAVLQAALGHEWEVVAEDVEAHPAFAYWLERGLVFDLDRPEGMIGRALARSGKYGGLVVP